MPPTLGRRRFQAFIAAALLAAGTGAHAQAVLRVTTIPEEAATEQARKFGPLVAYLERALAMKVEFTPVNDYPAAVEALVARKVDLAWLGGFTYIQARRRADGKVIPIAQRKEDARFQSVFIARKVDLAWLGGFTYIQARRRADGKVIPIAQRKEDARFQSVFIARKDSGIRGLGDLRGRQVGFGSPSSTSGHLMPRSFLLAAGLDPEKDFRRIAYSGAHDATIAAVVSGKVDAAALDFTVWRKFVQEGRVDTREVDVFYTTSPFFNYNWSVHADMPAELRDRIRAALMALSPADPAQAEILKLNRATRYIPTAPGNYESIERAARAAGLL